jgi:hypothetical protein
MKEVENGEDGSGDKEQNKERQGEDHHCKNEAVTNELFPFTHL